MILNFIPFSVKGMKASSIAPDGKPHSASSFLRLSFLLMCHKKDTRLEKDDIRIRVKCIHMTVTYLIGGQCNQPEDQK